MQNNVYNIMQNIFITHAFYTLNGLLWNVKI